MIGGCPHSGDQVVAVVVELGVDSSSFLSFTCNVLLCKIYTLVGWCISFPACGKKEKVWIRIMVMCTRR